MIIIIITIVVVIIIIIINIYIYKYILLLILENDSALCEQRLPHMVLRNVQNFQLHCIF